MTSIKINRFNLSEKLRRMVNMDIDDVIQRLKETSGTVEHKEILNTLSDDDLRALINKKYKDKPTHIKAIVFQGYKKQQEG